MKRRIKNEWANLNHAVHWTCCCRLAPAFTRFFLEADILSTWCKNDVTITTRWTIFKTLTASRVLLFNDSLKCSCSYCVDSSVCHFKFPMVAHILCEVGTVHSFVKSLFRDAPTSFYWYRFRFNRQRAQYKLARFLSRHGVDNLNFITQQYGHSVGYWLILLND